MELMEVAISIFLSIVSLLYAAFVVSTIKERPFEKPNVRKSSRRLELSGLNERQRWILDEIRDGTELKRCMVESRFAVSQKTAKRDLSEMAKAGLIEYVRSPYPGHWELVQDDGGGQ
jgi:predicted HTH transcriptional regulator